MGKWKHTVNFKWFWDVDDYTIDEKAKHAASELEKLLKHYEGDDTLEEIISDFKDISSDDVPAKIHDFDSIMYNLYDWADSEKVWVKTQF